MTEFVNVPDSHLLSELFAAVRRQDTSEILKILQVNSIDLSKTITDDDGDTLLHSASTDHFYLMREVILEIFLDRGADIDVKNSSGKTIFHLACERGDNSIIELCLRRNANVNVIDDHGNTAAHLIIESDRQLATNIYVLSSHSSEKEYLHELTSTIVDRMVDKGVDFFYARNKKGLSAIYLANELGLYHILLTLLKRVDDLASVEKDQTPLLLSFLQATSPPGSFGGPLYGPSIVKIILEKSKFISDATLLSSLRLAITSKPVNVIGMLLQRACVIDAHVIRGGKSLLETLFNERSPIYEGATFARLFYRCHPLIETIQFLKDVKADFSAKDDRGRSFLHSVCRRYIEDPKIIDLVMSTSCDVNVTDLEGRTPLHDAAGLCATTVKVKALIGHGANVNAKDNNGKTPLHFAVDVPKVAQLLLEAGADVNAKDNMAKTPLCCVRSDAVAKVLLSFGAHEDILDVNGHSPLYDLLLSKSHRAVIEMLKYGADIHNSDIVQFLQAGSVDLYPFGTDKWLYLKQHFTKLMAIDVYCRLPETVRSYNILKLIHRPFLEKCLKEVELLKNYFIDDRTSLYRLLRKNRNRRCAYLNNEKLTNLVEDASVEQEFPNYSILILGCYNQAARRKPLLKSASHILNKVSQIFLPDLCLDEILLYLSNSDLLYFSEAFENVNLDGSSKSMHRIQV